MWDVQKRERKELKKTLNKIERKIKVCNYMALILLKVF